MEVRELKPTEREYQTGMRYVIVANGVTRFYTKAALIELRNKINEVLH